MKEKTKKSIDISVEKEQVEEIKMDQPETTKKVAKVINGKLRVRDKASKTGSELCVVSSGDILQVIDDSDETWCKVCTPAGVEGYSMKEFLTITEEK